MTRSDVDRTITFTAEQWLLIAAAVDAQAGLERLIVGDQLADALLALAEMIADAVESQEP